MKKLIALFIVVVLIVLSVCMLLFRKLSYDLDDLTEKFNVCYSGIDLVTNKHELESKFNKTNDADSLSEYHISVNEKSNINVEFSSTATETKRGSGMFCVSYTISDVSDYNNFDVELFTEIVNSVSGRAITTDFVTEFLNAPEEKYSVEKYGLSGGDYDVEKMHALNFFEDWVIGCNLTYGNSAELWFYGYIK